MKNRQPTMAELMVGDSSSQPSHNEGIEKAAAQAQVGEVFQGLTKEAKEDLIGTMGWAGRTFGEQVGIGLQPALDKLAGLVGELKVAAKGGTMQENQELTGAYNQGTPNAAGKQPHPTRPAGNNAGGLPGKHTGMPVEAHTNVPGHIDDTETDPPGDKGWPTEGERARRATEKVTTEQGKTAAEASSVLSTLREGSGQGQTKEASDAQGQPDNLVQMGARFRDRLRAQIG